MAPQQGPCNWGTALQLLEEPGVAEAWVPAFPTDQVRGLQAHGKTGKFASYQDFGRFLDKLENPGSRAGDGTFLPWIASFTLGSRGSDLDCVAPVPLNQEY